MHGSMDLWELCPLQCALGAVTLAGGLAVGCVAGL
jgi:hypothetical protein